MWSEKTMLKKNLTIQEVINKQTGDVINANAFFSQPESIIFQKRRELEESNKQNKNIFICPYCYQPVKIRGKSQGTQSMHFAHFSYSGDCPIKTSGKYTEDEIKAMKYNGAKESERHKTLKYFIAECLKNDKRFSGIRIEKKIQQGMSKEWRRPDVSAKFGDNDIAFEIQLSTTFLSVIVEREIYYKDNNIFIIWFFDGSRNDIKSMRFSEKDIVYSNNNNAFILNNQIIEEYKHTKIFSFLCYYQNLFIDQHQLKSEWISRKIKFDDLIFDKEKYKLYYHDTNGIKQKLKYQLEYNTPWHRAWKSRFPKKWQNVALDHVANNNTVINFISSPLSYDELKQKELKQKENSRNQIVWVVNIDPSRIKLKNRAYESCKYVDEEYEEKSNRIIENAEYETKKVISKINSYNYDIITNESKKERINQKLERFQENRKNSKKISYEIAEKITRKSYVYISELDDPIRKIENEYKDKLLEISQKRSELNEKAESISNKINYFSSLNEVNIKNEKYKNIPNDQIGEFGNYWKDILYVLKRDVSTLFPEYKKFQTEREYKYLLFNKDIYYFYIDLQNEIESLTKIHISIKTEIDKIFEKYEYEIESISSKIISYCDLILRNSNNELQDVLQNISKIKNNIYLSKKQLEIINFEKERSINLLENWKIDKKDQIKSNNKNEYIWEYDRENLTVWLNTNSDVFFDTGDNSLLYLFNPPILKKININDFVLDATNKDI